MKKKFIILTSLFFISFGYCKDAAKTIPFPADFARGADISWVTEMEDDGIKFYNDSEEESDLFRLIKD